MQPEPRISDPAPFAVPEDSTAAGSSPSPAEASRDARIGTKLGSYRIVGVLGEGGMGIVYEGQEPNTGRRAAIKFLTDLNDNEAIRRFQAECRAASKVIHPNAVAVYDFGQQGNAHFMVMELVTGGNAKQFIEARGGFNWPEATRVVADACRGLQAAHDAGLIHRDIKPANIMRSHDGVVKLADFGLAKSTDGSQKSITATGNVVGTPQYMSPEQCRAETLDARSDIYSMGATYFVLLTGKTPYHKAGSTPQMMFGHCYEPVPDPRDLVSLIPERVVAIVQKAMAKNADERYQSAAEMLADLEAVLSGAAVVATQKTPDWNDFLNAAEGLRKPRTQAARPARPVAAFPWKPVAAAFGVVLAGVAGWMVLRGKAPATVVKNPESEQQAKQDDTPTEPPTVTKEDNTPKNTSSAVETKADVPTGIDDPARWKNAISLLPLIDPAKDVMGGKWTAEDGSFACTERALASRIEVPYRPPAEYDVRCVFVSRNYGDVHLVLVHDGKQFQLGCGERGNTICGFSHVGGKDSTDNASSTRQERCLIPGRAYTAVVQVRRSSAIAYLDGRAVAQWTPEMGKLWLWDRWNLSQSDSLGIGAWNSLAVFRSLEVLEVTGKGTFTRPEEPAAKKAMEQQRGVSSTANPLDEPWIKMVQGLPPEGQVKAVVGKLKELNPDFDGHVEKREIGNGVVIRLDIRGDGLKDIAPIRALNRLDGISLKSKPGRCELSDLMPLEGIRLYALTVSGSRVTDLNPVRNARLTYFNCADTPVQDLSPLAGMRLNYFDAGGCRVERLAVLQGMPLKRVEINGTPVADLAPLAQSPIEELRCDQTRVTDLAPVRNMPLKQIWCDYVPERDRDILRSVKTLKTINGKSAEEVLR